jgi:hypothetical protein
MGFALIEESTGELTAQSLTSRHVISQPAFSGTHPPEVSNIFSASVDALGNILDETARINADRRYSDEGREELLNPMRAKELEKILNAGFALKQAEVQIDGREAALLAKPAIDQAHSVAAIEAREIRDWLARFKNDGERIGAMETGNDQVVLAVIRSPIPMSDPLVAHANRVWAERRRAANPGEAWAIDNARASFEWQHRGLRQAAALAAIATGWDRTKILRHVAGANEQTREGHFAFGYGPADLAQMRERMRIETIVKNRVA